MCRPFVNPTFLWAIASGSKVGSQEQPSCPELGALSQCRRRTPLLRDKQKYFRCLSFLSMGARTHGEGFWYTVKMRLDRHVTTTMGPHLLSHLTDSYIPESVQSIIQVEFRDIRWESDESGWTGLGGHSAWRTSLVCDTPRAPRRLKISTAYVYIHVLTINAILG